MWLLIPAVRQAIEAAEAAGFVPNADQQAQYEARYGSADMGGSRILTIAGDVAQIDISGVITKTPSFLAMIFGGENVTYPEIIQALAEAEADPAVARAEVHIDSPGGNVDGLFNAIAAFESFSKPLKAVVDNVAASAAYSLAAQADEIVAGNRAARFGSVGVVASFHVDESVVDITSTKAPKKRPDITTPDGKAVVREELDGLHDLFADVIAEGRGVTAEKVNADFGQGATVLAGDALKRGMIDAIAEAPLRAVKSADSSIAASSGGNLPETGPMDLSTLKAQHPDVYQAAMQEGVNQERDRVSAHLTMGEASGDMQTAVAAINEGAGMTAAYQAKYFAAGMNRNDQQARAEDDAAAAAADAAAGGGDTPSAEQTAEQVAALVESQLGIAKE